MKETEIYHLNDKTIKYLALVQSKRQHQYLGLPGNFKIRLPQEIVFPNFEIGRVDECYLTDENMLIILEEESGDITENVLKKFAKYVIFESYRYYKLLYLVAVCHKNPKNEFELYEYAPSMFIKVFYHYFSQDEIWCKYENVIIKVKQKEKLTEMESLDIVFVSKFISKRYAPSVIENLIEIFQRCAD
ncbi:hypothetical protein [uncultured Methanobrevibacter sp.]|uniref:hypothetical protein n=1 Tax=uncultured Methanobrevibacter sp. TaxID=253161 RepID=UPI0025DFF7D9|nr:hypothetical protein [uncultured Methanobrevibacter sp.]